MKPFFRQIATVATSGIIIAQTCALTSCGSKTEAKSADAPQGQNPSPASNSGASSISSPSKIIALGRVEPEGQITELSMEASGVVQKVAVRDGDAVRAGATILELDNSVESARVALAQSRATTQKQEVGAILSQIASAQLKSQNQKDRYERLKKIFESGAETQQNLDNAKTDYETALREIERLQATMRSAESRLAEFNADARVSAAEVQRRILKAPSDGTILKINPTPGSAVASGKSIGDFAPKGALTVICEVDELFVGSVALGQKATVRLQGMQEIVASGEVITIGPYLKKKSLFSDEAAALEDRRVREVRVRLSDAGKLLLNTRVECVIQVK